MELGVGTTINWTPFPLGTGRSFHPPPVTPTESSHLFTWQRDASNVCLQGLRHRFLPGNNQGRHPKTSEKFDSQQPGFKEIQQMGQHQVYKLVILILRRILMMWIVLYIGFIGLTSLSKSWTDPPGSQCIELEQLVYMHSSTQVWRIEMQYFVYTSYRQDLAA